jgi:hypothetical protein
VERAGARSWSQNDEPTDRNVFRGRRRERAGTAPRSPDISVTGKAWGCIAKVTSLTPGETCPAGAAAGAQRAVAGNDGGQRAGISRNRSGAGNEPGAGDLAQAQKPNGPEGLTHARWTELVGIAETAAASRLAMTPYGRGDSTLRRCGCNVGKSARTHRPAHSGSVGSLNSTVSLMLPCPD